MCPYHPLCAGHRNSLNLLLSSGTTWKSAFCILQTLSHTRTHMTHTTYRCTCTHKHTSTCVHMHMYRILLCSIKMLTMRKGERFHQEWFLSFGSRSHEACSDLWVCPGTSENSVSTTAGRIGLWSHPVISREAKARGSQIQDLLWLQSEFKASLGNLISSISFCFMFVCFILF